MWLTDDKCRELAQKRRQPSWGGESDGSQLRSIDIAVVVAAAVVVVAVVAAVAAVAAAAAKEEGCHGDEGGRLVSSSLKCC